MLSESKGVTSVSVLDPLAVCGPAGQWPEQVTGGPRCRAWSQSTLDQDRVGLVALTSSHIVPEMVFAGAPLKCFRELDRARADIPEEDAKSVDIDGVVVLPCGKKGPEISCIPVTRSAEGITPFFLQAFTIHDLPL